MSGQDVRVDPEGVAAAPEPDEPVPAAPAPAQAGRRGPASFLAGLQAEQKAIAEDEFKTLPIGKSSHLFARYRSLEDEEEAELDERAERREKLASRAGREADKLERENLRAAEYLARACVEILAIDPAGKRRPLHEILADPDQEGDEAPEGPLRYDRVTASKLLPDLEDEIREDEQRTLRSADVVMALHRWGQEGSLKPLRTTAGLLKVWGSGMNAEAFAETVQGL